MWGLVLLICEILWLVLRLRQTFPHAITFSYARFPLPVVLLCHSVLNEICMSKFVMGILAYSSQTKA